MQPSERKGTLRVVGGLLPSERMTESFVKRERPVNALQPASYSHVETPHPHVQYMEEGSGSDGIRVR